MNIAVRYFSKTGNTEKLAKTVSLVAGIQAFDVTKRLDNDTDILFLCNSVYFAGINPAVKTFLTENAKKIKHLVNVSSAALIESSYGQIKKICKDLGIDVLEKEYHCRGSFMVMHKGHPDEDDLEALEKFVREVLDECNK